MVRASSLGLGFILAIGSACGSGAPASGNTASSTTVSAASDEAALMQTSRDWAKVTASGDVDKILSYWTDDAIVMEAGVPALVGKGAIGSMIETALKTPNFSISWEPERASIARSGDMGYLIEHHKVTFPDPAGKVQTTFGKCLTVWKKDASGNWKNAVDICNANPTEKALPGGS